MLQRCLLARMDANIVEEFATGWIRQVIGHVRAINPVVFRTVQGCEEMLLRIPLDFFDEADHDQYVHVHEAEVSEEVGNSNDPDGVNIIVLMTMVDGMSWLIENGD